MNKRIIKAVIIMAEELATPKQVLRRIKLTKPEYALVCELYMLYHQQFVEGIADISSVYDNDYSEVLE